MQFELLVRSIKPDGTVEQYSVIKDQQGIDDAFLCARLCSDTCKAWKVRDGVYIVVYLPVKGEI